MNYKILVVDDREENRAAAKSYFDTRSDVEVDYAADYESALQKLQDELYAFGIFDLEIPKNKGSDCTRHYGFKLAEEAETQHMSWAIVTLGIDHHNCKAAFVRCDCNGLAGLEHVLEENGLNALWDHGLGGENLRQLGFGEITETPKTDPRAWKVAYEKLLEANPNMSELLASRKRLRERKQGG
jgi:hypothetical protein